MSKEVELSRGKAFDSTERVEKIAHKHGLDEDLFDMVEDSWAGVQGVVANISATGQHKNRWCMLPSVGTWFTQPSLFKKTEEKIIHVAGPAVDEAELSMREAAFASFWAQLDQEEENERASYIESELSLRQAASDFFWAQVDQEEEDERASYIESELSLRQAAFDLFWAWLDQEEEDERASYIESELSLRRAAFDFFWADLDQKEEDERASYIESELSLRQAAFDFFWAQLDKTHSKIDEPEKHPIYAKVVDPEKHAKISRGKIAHIPQLEVDGIAQNLEERPMFSMAGSPAKSIRLAKLSLSLSVDAPLGLSPSQLLSVSHKSNGTKKRSSSTSAMAIDLGHSKANTSVIDSVSTHPQAVLLKQEHIAKFSVKMGELPPLKRAKMCVTVPSPQLPRGY